MGIHLVLQGHVAVFGEVPFLPLRREFTPDIERVFDHVGDPEEGHLHQQGDDDVPGEEVHVHPPRPVEGDPEGVQQGAEDGNEADEKRRADGGDIQAVVLVMARPHEEDRPREHAQQDQRIAQEGPEIGDDVHPLELAFPEQNQFDEHAEGEHGDDGEDQPPQVFLPGVLPPGRNVVGPGEKVQRPAQDFRGEEGGQGVVQEGRRELEELRAQVSQHIPQDVHQDDADGREFHGEIPPVADEDRHEHSQDGEDDRVGNAGEGAYDGHHGVQRRETVDKPRSSDPFHILC